MNERCTVSDRKNNLGRKSSQFNTRGEEKPEVSRKRDAFINQTTESLTAERSIFQIFSRDDLRQIVLQSEKKRYGKSEWVKVAGTKWDFAIHVISGDLLLYYGEHLIGSRGPHQNVGLIAQLLPTNHYWPISVVSTGESEILCISDDVLDEALERNKQVPSYVSELEKLEATHFILRFWFQNSLISFPQDASIDARKICKIKLNDQGKPCHSSNNVFDKMRRKAFEFEQNNDIVMAIYSHEQRLKIAMQEEDKNEEFLARFDLVDLFEKCWIQSKEMKMLESAKDCMLTFFSELENPASERLAEPVHDAMRHAAALILRRVTLHYENPIEFLHWAKKCMDLEQASNLIPDQACSQVCLGDAFEAAEEFDESLTWRRAHLLTVENATRFIAAEETELGRVAAFVLGLAHSALASTLIASAVNRLNRRSANALTDYKPIHTSKFPVAEQMQLIGPHVDTHLIANAQPQIVRGRGEEVLTIGTMESETDDEWILVQKPKSGLQGFVPAIYLRISSDKAAASTLQESLRHLDIQTAIAKRSENKLLEWCAHIQRGWVFQILHRADQGTKPFAFEFHDSTIPGGSKHTASHLAEAQNAVFKARDIAALLVDFEARRLTMEIVRRLQRQALPDAGMKLELLKQLRRACPEFNTDARVFLSS